VVAFVNFLSLRSPVGTEENSQMAADPATSRIQV